MIGIGVGGAEILPAMEAMDTVDVVAGADVVVTMGCGDECPYIPGRRYVDWDLPDPKGRPIEEVRIGDRVLAQDPASGVLNFQPVLMAYHNPPAPTLRIALGDEAVAVTAVSDSLAQGELEEAEALARRIGIRHRVIRTEEFADPNYLRNQTDRCYFCKSELYGRLEGLLGEFGADVIASGANADDLGDHADVPAGVDVSAAA